MACAEAYLILVIAHEGHVWRIEHVKIQEIFGIIVATAHPIYTFIPFLKASTAFHTTFLGTGPWFQGRQHAQSSQRHGAPPSGSCQNVLELRLETPHLSHFFTINP